MNSQTLNISTNNFSPTIETCSLKTKLGAVIVVRDDALAGGTKQRAAVPYLQKMKERGFKHFIYASPFSGYAQIALAIAAKAVGVECTIYAEAKDNLPSEFTLLAGQYAKIKLFPTLEAAENAAQLSSGFLIPLGFNDPLYKSQLKKELTEQWNILCESYYIPDRLWLPVGSGTLANIFREIVGSTKLLCVDVGVLTPTDHRIQHARAISHKFCRVNEKFSEVVMSPPPIPSNKFYDAKLWQYVYEFGEIGDVWWNVAA